MPVKLIKLDEATEQPWKGLTKEVLEDYCRMHNAQICLIDEFLRASNGKSKEWCVDFLETRRLNLIKQVESMNEEIEKLSKAK